MAYYNFPIGQVAWCDNCALEVVTIDGEHLGGICPICSDQFFLMELEQMF